ncbi:MAG: helix-turn-helix domain-containing protein [Anaerocolumna sp.]
MDYLPTIKGDIIALNLVVEKKQDTHFHDDIELFYLLEGTGKLTVENEVFFLNKDDFIIINSGKKHSYIASEDVLLGIFTISYPMLSDMIYRSFLVYWCNSVIDKNEAYQDTRQIIRNIFNQYFGKKEEGNLYLVSLLYALLHVLNANFLLSPKDKRFEAEKSKFDGRIYEIMQYVWLNYNKDISLGNLANRLYLSQAYLSKYIKRKLGVSFVNYLKSIRLQHAVSDLIYRESSIIRIALENGFPNVAAFNKTFKEEYHMTPSSYQKNYRNQYKDVEKQGDNALVKERLNNYFEKNPKGKINSSIIQDIHTDVTKVRNYQKNWNKMINIGAASDLLRSDMQEHILMLKNKLQFQYVRFWGAFSTEMYINIKTDEKQYNFDRMDRILDFLVTNGIKPYMELSYKPKKLLRNLYSVLIEEEIKYRADTVDEVEVFIRAFIIHLINRYGIEEIESWYFEIWKEETEAENAAQGKYVQSNEEYLNIFDSIAKTMKRYSPNFRIGGAGLGIRFGQKNFKEILTDWKMKHILPDFLSLYCYPFIPGEVDGEVITKPSTDRSYMKNQLIMAKELMEDIDFHVAELHVTEWSSTVSNRSVLNDHCNKGAYIMKNIIDSIGLADLTGYWVGSDLFADYYDSQAILNGGCGLITKDGILKPAFYAVEFMNRLGKKLLQKGDNYMITYCGYSNYGIACHNYKHYSYSYFLHKENEISIKEINQMFIDRDKIRLCFILQNIKNGNYLLKIQSINPLYGSVQDEWLQMDLITAANKEEIEYLKRVCTPRLAVKKCEVKDTLLHIEVELEPNEFQYIQILYQY